MHHLLVRLFSFFFFLVFFICLISILIYLHIYFIFIAAWLFWLSHKVTHSISLYFIFLYFLLSIRLPTPSSLLIFFVEYMQTIQKQGPEKQKMWRNRTEYWELTKCKMIMMMMMKKQQQWRRRDWNIKKIHFIFFMFILATARKYKDENYECNWTLYIHVYTIDIYICI